jgi:hypothetical protein
VSMVLSDEERLERRRRSRQAWAERNPEKNRALKHAARDRRVAEARKKRAARLKRATKKLCSGCGRSLPLEQFYRRNDTSSGRYSRCKDCLSERDRRRAQERYKIERQDPVKRRQNCSRVRAWETANKERRNQYLREYNKQHPEKKRERQRRWAQSPRGKERLRVKKLRLIAAYELEVLSAEGLDLKWEFWGGRCWMCGKKATTWDHVKPLSRGGLHCLANLRPACVSCNSSKRDRWPWSTSGRKHAQHRRRI